MSPARREEFLLKLEEQPSIPKFKNKKGGFNDY